MQFALNLAYLSPHHGCLLNKAKMFVALSSCSLLVWFFTNFLSFQASHGKQSILWKYKHLSSWPLSSFPVCVCVFVSLTLTSFTSACFVHFLSVLNFYGAHHAVLSGRDLGCNTPLGFCFFSSFCVLFLGICLVCSLSYFQLRSLFINEVWSAAFSSHVRLVCMDVLLQQIFPNCKHAV